MANDSYRRMLLSDFVYDSLDHMPNIREIGMAVENLPKLSELHAVLDICYKLLNEGVQRTRQVWNLLKQCVENLISQAKQEAKGIRNDGAYSLEQRADMNAIIENLSYIESDFNELRDEI